MTKEESIRNKIIEVLSENWPLTAKQIYNKLQRSHGVSVSYQAVHKQLKKMISEKIILKNERELSLNSAWIENKKNFFENLLNSLNKNYKKENGVISFSFDSYNEFAKTMLRVFVKEWEDDPENSSCVTFQKHLYWVLSLGKTDYSLLKKLGEKGGHILCSENSFLDKALAAIYRGIGYRVKLGVDYKNSYDFVVFNNIVHQIYFSDKQEKDVEEFSRKVGNTKELISKGYHNKFFEKKEKIQVIMFENKELAEKLKTELLSYFK